MGEFTLFSLFSGAGGMDAGFRMEGGFKLIAANDCKADASETYRNNFEHAVKDIEANPYRSALSVSSPTYFKGDVDWLDFNSLDIGEVDVIVGGPPCQDFSLMRGPMSERQGVVVTRGRLYSHFMRSLAHLQPKMVVFENVPGLRSANDGTAYKTIMGDFSQLSEKYSEIGKSVGNGSHVFPKNYTILYSKILDPVDIGVPQRRHRLIIIGIREDLITGGQPQKERMENNINKVLSGETLHFRRYPLTSLEVFTGKTLYDLEDDYRKIMKAYSDCANKVGTTAAIRWKEETLAYPFDLRKDYARLSKIENIDEDEMRLAMGEHEAILRELGYWNRNLSNEEFPDGSNRIKKESCSVLERLNMIPPDKNHVFVKGTKWNVEGRGMSLIYRRLHPLKPSPTVVAYGGGGTWGYHYLRDRARLTNRERARLQTFPDNFEFSGKEQEVRAQIGEAVPCILGKAIARTVKDVLEIA